MFNDDEDDDAEDFNFEDFEPTEEDLEEVRKERERVHNMPIMKKAEHIADLTLAIVESIDEEKDELHVCESMMGNAYILAAKIAGAEGGDLYTLRMENAVVIKMHARELLAQTSLCKAEDLTDSSYLQVLRDEIEEFRKLFIDWVKSFDKSNDIKDEWGLFY